LATGQWNLADCIVQRAKAQRRAKPRPCIAQRRKGIEKGKTKTMLRAKAQRRKENHE